MGTISPRSTDCKPIITLINSVTKCQQYCQYTPLKQQSHIKKSLKFNYMKLFTVITNYQPNILIINNHSSHRQSSYWQKDVATKAVDNTDLW